MFSLLRHTFVNLNVKTLRGYAALLMYDQDNFRNRPSNSRNRNQQKEQEPFETLACAASEKQTNKQTSKPIHTIH